MRAGRSPQPQRSLTRRADLGRRDVQARRRLRAILAVGALGVALTPVAAQSARRPATFDFDIPGQPLYSALETYSRIAGVTIFYGAAVGADARSSPVKGVLTPSVALAEMLKTSGLTPSYENDRNVVLVAKSAAFGGSGEGAAPPSEAGGPILALGVLRVEGIPQARPVVRHEQYAHLVASDIQRALRGRLADRDYHATVQIWVSAAGRIERAITFRSSDPSADRTLSLALQGVLLGQSPPAGMPQPVNITIVARRP